MKNTAAIATIDTGAGITVSLDQAQRLNLVMLIGNMEANVGEMRALWQLQDRLSLSLEEQQEIGLFSRVVNGMEVQGWDVTKSIPARVYDLSEGDIARLGRALQGYPRHKVMLARPWMEPLFSQLPQLLDGHEPH
jgi:hypothetical protein